MSNKRFQGIDLYEREFDGSSLCMYRIVPIQAQVIFTYRVSLMLFMNRIADSLCGIFLRDKEYNHITVPVSLQSLGNLYFTTHTYIYNVFTNASINRNVIK